MKRTTKTILAIALVLAAQDGLASWSVAPTVGASSFKLSGSDLDSRSGVLAGAQVLYATGVEGLQVETGLNYLEAGAKTDALFASAEITLGYLAVPVLANYKLYSTSGGTEFFVKGGAYLTQLMSAKQTVSFFGASEETDVKDQMNSNDVLATVGLGGRWTVFENMKLALDFNYAKGLMKVAKETGGTSEGFILGSSLIIPL